MLWGGDYKMGGGGREPNASCYIPPLSLSPSLSLPPLSFSPSPTLSHSLTFPNPLPPTYTPQLTDTHLTSLSYPICLQGCTAAQKFCKKTETAMDMMW